MRISIDGYRIPEIGDIWLGHNGTSFKVEFLSSKEMRLLSKTRDGQDMGRQFHHIENYMSFERIFEGCTFINNINELENDIANSADPYIEYESKWDLV